jgi:hypothetical protein
MHPSDKIEQNGYKLPISNQLGIQLRKFVHFDYADFRFAIGQLYPSENLCSNQLYGLNFS